MQQQQLTSPQRGSRYPTPTQLALVTGVSVMGSVVVKSSSFFEDDLVLAQASFWNRASRYLHVANGRVVIPANRAFAEDLLTVGLDDPQWLHGADRIVNLVDVALAGGYQNVCISID